MHSSTGVANLLQDSQLLNRDLRPASTTPYRSRATVTRTRPLSAPPSRPPWRNPGSPEPKRSRKFHLSLNHTPLESRVSKRAPYASRPFLGGSTTLSGQEFSPAVYNSLSDPHLNEYFSRKFGASSSLQDSGVARPCRTKRYGGTKKKGKGILYTVVVNTGPKKNAGTDARVHVEFRGTQGKFWRQLTHQVDAGVPAAYIATLPPFQFNPGCKETFNIKGPDLGELRQLTVEHDGKERKQGWFLEDIDVSNTKTGQRWIFPCHQWLSLYEGDCKIARQLKPVAHQKLGKVVYVIEVETGDKAGAGTDAHVFVTLFGKRGHTPKTQLVNRNEDTFERKRKDVFKIKTKALGALTKMIIEHDNFGFSAGWYLDKVTVYDREFPEKKYYFPCHQWLAKDEGDHQIVRQLTATTDQSASSEGYVYMVNTYTGDRRGAGTDANVSITIFGEDGDSGEHKLDNARNNFERAKKDTFKVHCGAHLGPLSKIRIGHDNSGLGPGWFLEKVTIEDPETKEVAEFTCRRWLSKSEDDGKLSRELVRDGANGDQEIKLDKGIPYHIHVTTGDIRNAGTDARVYVILHGGEEGELNSGKIWLENDTRDNFKRGRTDIFTVETATMLSPLHHLTLGHDNSGLGAGFFCEKVVVDCPSSGHQQVFLCRKWLADDEDDCLVERDLYESEDMRLKRRPKEVWNVWVWTSDVRGAGTDANVFITIYGNKGKTDETQIGNATDNFEKGELDKFKLELPKIGKPYKVRVRHDNSNPFPDWHLEKIQIQNARSEEKFTFKCNRWLSKSEDDHQIVRELPAEGQDLPVHSYHVFVHTGDKRGAGTDANVFIVIFGSLGDTGERALEESKNNRNKFERKQVDEFMIDAVTLKDLQKIRVGHDNKGGSAAWFLDKIEIRDPEDPTKTYDFPCNRWLSKDEDDGAIVRELALGGTSLLSTTSYHLSVRTGDVRGAGTDANVYVIIHGESGDTGTLQLRLAQNTKNKFERGRTDKFTLEAVDIGKVQMLRIGHDNSKAGSAWFLEDVVLDIPSRGDHVTFPCHRWLASDEDDGKTERELYPSEYQESSPKIPYEVVVYTGDVRGAGTNSNVFLILYGEKGKSDEFPLRNKSDNFERAQVDKFKVECEDIGPLTKIRIGHDNAGIGSAWFLDKVEIRRFKDETKETPKKKTKRRSSRDKDEEEEDVEYLFVCNRWLAKDEDDGQVVRELVPVGADGKARAGSLAENTYRVHVYTGDISSAGTNSNVFLTLYGEHGDSGEQKLDKSETHLDKFERDHEDIFSLMCINLGNLSKAKIRHDNSGLKSAWFLDRVEVEDKLAGSTTVFPCCRWLATSEDDGQICRELVPVDEQAFKLERQRSIKRRNTIGGRKGSQVSLVDGVELEHKARTTTYEVSVVTGDVRGAGTDANVYIILYGDNDDTGKIPLKTSQSNKNKFERNQTDVFPVDANVGEVRKIRIGHDNKGGFAGWFLDSVTINVPSLGQKAFFPCGRWLDKGKDDGLLERELLPGEAEDVQAYRPHVPYEITVYTSDVSGAGTNANVFIALYGSEGNTEDIVLADTSKKKKKTFDRGSIDQFVKELEDVGDVIEKIRIGHDGKGLGAGWHLDKVEIRRLLDNEGSSSTFTFVCRRWLAKDEDDGAIVRELVPQKVVEEVVTEDGKIETKEVDQVTLDVRKYRVHVFTGDVKGAGTDANVYMTIFGDYGDSGERQLSKSSTYTDKFERGHEDIFTLEAADLGNVYKIKLRHDNSKLNPSWFVDKIEIKDMETDRMYPFIVERWLAKGKEDKKIERTLYVKGYEGDRSTLGTMSMRSLGRESPRSSPRSSPRGSPHHSRRGSRSSLQQSTESIAHARRSSTADEVFVKELSDGGKKEPDAIRPTIPYTIRVTTGDDPEAGTEAKAYVVFIGDEAVTEKIPLELMQKPGFEPGLTETFSVEAVDVGKVKKLEVGHNGQGLGAGWFIKDVEVDVPTLGAKYFFPCDRWLSKDKDDGKTKRILTASDDQMVTYKPHVPYEMEIYTGDVKNAGTDSQVSMTLYGSEGATPEVTLEKEESRFERANVDVIRTELENVGKLVKMRIGIDGKGTRPSWFLDKIILRNTDTGAVSVFKCNQWLSKDMEDGKLVRELACETDGVEEDALKKTTYKVTVKTGDVSGAGTDANVFMIIFGENGDCGELALKNSETYKDKFERNHEDVFVFKNVFSLGELSKVRIWHDNKFLGASWFLDSVEVLDETTGKSYSFPCQRWLAKDKDDKSLLRELPCANPQEKEEKGSTVYEVTLLTSDKQNAGTTQNAWLVMEGEERTSREFVIENSPKNKVLRRGNIDTFKFKSKPLGPLTFVTVGHRKKEGTTVKGTGKDSAWFLHEVIVSNETSGTFVFPCRQWIPLSNKKKDAVQLECKTSEKPRLSALRELQPVQYLVEVRTADEKYAGTDANVFLTIYGTNGDTGKRPLTKKFVDLFERGKTDDFKLEALDLGQLTRLRIEHDNKGFGAGWLLDKVDVTNMTSQEKVTFPCNQWLDKKKGDGKISRDIFPLAK